MTTKGKHIPHECEDFRAGRPCRCPALSRLGEAIAIASEDEAARQRCVESLRQLSVTVDRDLAPADADLCQIAITSLLEKLGYILPPLPSQRVH